MSFALVATVCAGIFAGAAIYITLVEHPARVSCGTALALREFAPSYRRATIMQAGLAFVGLLTALEAWSRTRALELLVGGRGERLPLLMGLGSGFMFGIFLLWLRPRDRTAIKAFEESNAIVIPLQERLYEEIRGRIKETDESAPDAERPAVHEFAARDRREILRRPLGRLRVAPEELAGLRIDPD